MRGARVVLRAGFTGASDSPAGVASDDAESAVAVMPSAGALDSPPAVGVIGLAVAARGARRTGVLRGGFASVGGTATDGEADGETGSWGRSAGASCAMALPSRSGSVSGTGKTGVCSSGSEFGGTGVTSLTYQGPSDLAEGWRRSQADSHQLSDRLRHRNPRS